MAVLARPFGFAGGYCAFIVVNNWAGFFVNANNDQRIHLVADTVGGAKFWSLVEHGRRVRPAQRERQPGHVVRHRRPGQDRLHPAK